MKLEEYQKKRHFEKTSEPKAIKKTTPEKLFRSTKTSGKSSTLRFPSGNKWGIKELGYPERTKFKSF